MVPLTLFGKLTWESSSQGVPARDCRAGLGNEAARDHAQADRHLFAAQGGPDARASLGAGLLLHAGGDLPGRSRDSHLVSDPHAGRPLGLSVGGLLSSELPARAGVRRTFALASLASETPASTTMWTVATMYQTAQVFGSIFQDAANSCSGASKAFKTASEPVCRVIATIMSGAVISHVKHNRGVERLYVNLAFSLQDEDGELHPPKDQTCQWALTGA